MRIDQFSYKLAKESLSQFGRHINRIIIAGQCQSRMSNFTGYDIKGIEAQQVSDHRKIKKMMEAVGGRSATNVFECKLINTVNRPWFRSIESSWAHDRLDRYGLMCGEGIKLLQDQNSSITYKDDLKISGGVHAQSC